MSVEQLRASRTKATAIFTQFTRLYKKDRKALFCFFEGGDAEYYGSRIRTISRPETYHYLLCSGKSGVLGIHWMLSTRKYYQNARCAYFVDRDFDPSVESNGLLGQLLNNRGYTFVLKKNVYLLPNVLKFGLTEI